MQEKRKLEKKRALKVTILGAIADILLGVCKIVIGQIFNSYALVVDGFHSLSDLLSDIFVLFMTKISYEEPDEQHPYGHGRFETLGTTIVGIILLIVGGFLIYENVVKLLGGGSSHIPGWPTIVVALISVIVKEVVFRYSYKVGKDLNSQLLMANAWHSRSDAISSLIVLIGLFFAILKFPIVDSLMALGLSAFISKMGWDFIIKSLKELVDTSLDKDTRDQIQTIIEDIDGVTGLHNLRSRMVGNKAVLDVNIEVKPWISVSEGHEIATWVARKIKSEMDDILDVTVHTDIEDDRGEEGTDVHHSGQKRALLPLRKDIDEQFKLLLADSELAKIERYLIHYREGKVQLDIYLKELCTNEKNQIEWKLKQVDLVSEVRFFVPF